MRRRFVVDCVWNVMAYAQKPDFLFRRNGRVHLNRRGRHFSRVLAAEVCASAVVMLDIPCSEVVWRVLATHSFRQFPLHFPSRASPCAVIFQLDSRSWRGSRRGVAETHHYYSCLFLVRRNILEPQGLEQKVQGFGKTLLDQVERRVSTGAFTITWPPT